VVCSWWLSTFSLNRKGSRVMNTAVGDKREVALVRQELGVLTRE
jgi:hypothetical protein